MLGDPVVRKGAVAVCHAQAATASRLEDFSLSWDASAARTSIVLTLRARILIQPATPLVPKPWATWYSGVSLIGPPAPRPKPGQ